MAKFMLISSLLFFLNAEAYTPTPESLFRNSRNQDLNSKLVIIETKIEKIEEEGKTFNVKYFFYIDENDQERMIQINEGESQLIYKPYTSLVGLKINNEDIDKASFYGVLKYLFTNKGDLIIDLAKKNGSTIKKNKEVQNREYINLIYSYKTFLAEQKNKEVTKNPLVGDSKEDKERIKEILAQGFYGKQENFSLERNDDNFFWQFKDNVLKSSFGHKNHELQKLEVNTSYGSVMYEFKLYNNASNLNYFFPSYIYFKDAGSRLYKIAFEKVMVLSETNQGFSKRLERLKEEKVIDSSIKLDKPFFLF